MRIGKRNKWEYNGFPPILCACEQPATTTLDGRHYCHDCAPSYYEREFDRQFPHTDSVASDNAASLARFHKLNGTRHKVTVEVTDIVGKSRREETYERLADKYKDNKYFNGK